jgi:hypothetical protein
MTPSALSSKSRTRQSRSALAGYVHAGAWIAGLAVGWGVLPEAGDSHTEIATAYDAHPAQAIAQSALTHGLAAAAIGIIAAALLAAGRRTAGWAGALAAVLALIQLVLEQVAISDLDRAGSLFDLSLRVDGIKMLAFAVMAVAMAPILSATWQKWTAYATAAAITISGLGYLGDIAPLSMAALFSLPLLLVWMVLAGRQAG